MLSSFVTAVASGAANGPRRCLWVRFRRAVPSAPGVATDTSPRFGCCLATNSAIWELAANAAASNFSLTVARSRQSLVSVWELVDFIGRQFAPTHLFFSQNKEVPNAFTTD
jgi:hypothetical protein